MSRRAMLLMGELGSYGELDYDPQAFEAALSEGSYSPEETDDFQGLHLVEEVEDLDAGT